MPLDRSDVEAALTSKGFTYKGGDHRFYFLEHSGLTTAVFTKVSHGSKFKTIGDKMASSMAKQLKLTNKQFYQLVECSMTGSEYVSHLKSLGVIR